MTAPDLSAAAGKRGKSSAGKRTHRELRSPRRDPRFVVIGFDDDRARLQCPHDVDDQPGRNDTHAVLARGHRGAGLDGEIEVGAGDVQLIAG